MSKFEIGIRKTVDFEIVIEAESFEEAAQIAEGMVEMYEEDYLLENPEDCGAVSVSSEGYDIEVQYNIELEDEFSEEDDFDSEDEEESEEEFEEQTAGNWYPGGSPWDEKGK